jgi:hypothetical protein
VVLMVSGNEPHVPDLLAGYHDLPCLSKPVSFDALANKLEEVLGRPARSAIFRRSMGPPRRRPSGQRQE